jgi:hypothetical protein
MLVDPNARAVDHLQFAIVGFGNFFQQVVPDAGPPPAHKAVVAGGMRAIALRNVRPGAARPKAPQNAVDHPPVINPRHAPALVRQQRLDHGPLEICQVKAAAHDKAPSTNGNLESKPRPKLNN